MISSSRGLKPHPLLTTNAALKRRSSTAAYGVTLREVACAMTRKFPRGL
jgi:hypothetical protein